MSSVGGWECTTGGCQVVECKTKSVCPVLGIGSVLLAVARLWNVRLSQSVQCWGLGVYYWRLLGCGM